MGPGTSGKVQAMSNWVCFLCLPLPHGGLLQRRPKWRGRLKAFYDRESVRAARGRRPRAQRPGVLSVTGCKLPPARYTADSGFVLGFLLDSTSQQAAWI